MARKKAAQPAQRVERFVRRSIVIMNKDERDIQKWNPLPSRSEFYRVAGRNYIEQLKKGSQELPFTAQK